jgi:hypothetical protein
LYSISDGLSTGSVKPTIGPPPPKVVADVPDPLDPKDDVDVDPGVEVGVGEPNVEDPLVGGDPKPEEGEPKLEPDEPKLEPEEPTLGPEDPKPEFDPNPDDPDDPLVPPVPD